MPVKIIPNINPQLKLGLTFLALYNSLFKRTKYFYARWKRRPGIDEPKFGDNRNFLERFKNSFLFRFK